MKVKHISILLAAALTLAACSKSEIQYESPSDICFAPASKNITKAAMPAGVLDKNVKLGVWAYWNGVNGTVESTATYANYTDAYLDNSLFANRADTDNWGGYDRQNEKEVAYPWPSSGALVFAGYTLPTSGYIDSGVSYTLNGPTSDTSDKMVITGYKQNIKDGKLESDDLCWFSATTESYNYRTAASGAVSVTLNHALTWITFKAYGSGTPVISEKEWVITDITLTGVNMIGTATCTGNTVTWETQTPVSIQVYSNSKGHPLTTLPTGDKTLPAIENVENKNNTLVIPQIPKKAEITYKTSPTSEPVKKTIDLTLDNTKDQNGNANTKITEWEAGKHYTYTLHFKSNEIRVTPSYGEWTSTDQSITVE